MYNLILHHIVGEIGACIPLFILWGYKIKKGETWLWDISEDVHDPLNGGGGLLELAVLSLDESYIFMDDQNEKGRDENDIVWDNEWSAIQ